jgi:hypothetical protein
VFPPPALTGSIMGPPVLEKKLIEDGTWALRKEVLGWLFDGLARTIELPQKKCKEILADLKVVRHVKRLERCYKASTKPSYDSYPEKF